MGNRLFRNRRGRNQNNGSSVPGEAKSGTATTASDSKETEPTVSPAGTTAADAAQAKDPSPATDASVASSARWAASDSAVNKEGVDAASTPVASPIRQPSKRLGGFDDAKMSEVVSVRTNQAVSKKKQAWKAAHADQQWKVTTMELFAFSKD